MSERAIADPSQHGWTEVDGKWMWAAGLAGGYDDAEVRGLIADNASDIAALQEQPHVDAYSKTESDAKYALTDHGHTEYVPKSGDTTITGTLTATDMVATG